MAFSGYLPKRATLCVCNKVLILGWLVLVVPYESTLLFIVCFVIVIQFFICLKCLKACPIRLDYKSTKIVPLVGACNGSGNVGLFTNFTGQSGHK